MVKLMCDKNLPPVTKEMLQQLFMAKNLAQKQNSPIEIDEKSFEKAPPEMQLICPSIEPTLSI